MIITGPDISEERKSSEQKEETASEETEQPEVATESVKQVNVQFHYRLVSGF